MKNKIIIPIILFILIVGFSIFAIYSERNKGNSFAISGGQINDEINNEINNGNQNNQEGKENLTPTNNNQTKSSSLIYYYGEGCPHCAIVQDFLEKNDIRSKISFEKKEVYYDAKNARELMDKAKRCGIPENQVGVPFLWDGSNCIVGDQPIIDFFKKKIGI